LSIKINAGLLSLLSLHGGSSFHHVQMLSPLVPFLHEFTGALHPLLNLQMILILQITQQMLTKSTGSTASFKTHDKSNQI
jgi:hypothetical protein